MGMFDYIKIASKLLPTNENLFIPEDEWWQTKSLDRSLKDFQITENGIIDISDKENPIDIEFHGFVQFYTSIDNFWLEFKAKFTDGKLVVIEKIAISKL